MSSKFTYLFLIFIDLIICSDTPTQGQKTTVRKLLGINENCRTLDTFSSSLLPITNKVQTFSNFQKVQMIKPGIIGFLSFLNNCSDNDQEKVMVQPKSYDQQILKKKFVSIISDIVTYTKILGCRTKTEWDSIFIAQNSPYNTVEFSSKVYNLISDWKFSQFLDLIIKSVKDLESEEIIGLEADKYEIQMFLASEKSCFQSVSEYNLDQMITNARSNMNIIEEYKEIYTESTQEKLNAIGTYLESKLGEGLSFDIKMFILIYDLASFLCCNYPVISRATLDSLINDSKYLDEYYALKEVSYKEYIFYSLIRLFHKGYNSILFFLLSTNSEVEINKEDDIWKLITYQIIYFFNVYKIHKSYRLTDFDSHFLLCLNLKIADGLKLDEIYSTEANILKSTIFETFILLMKSKDENSESIYSIVNSFFEKLLAYDFGVYNIGKSIEGSILGRLD